MSVFLTAVGMVMLAEIGDKTQLLTLLLVARFGKPFIILLSIICSTLFNHSLAAAVGDIVGHWLNQGQMHFVIAIGFILTGLWLLLPDKNDSYIRGNNAFLTSFTVFFIAEMGDKTQVATLLLGAQYNNLMLVVIGSTAGMILANAPMLWFGSYLKPYMEKSISRYIASGLFILLGAISLIYSI